MSREITEEKLLAGYLRATSPATCKPDPCRPKIAVIRKIPGQFEHFLPDGV